MGKYISIVIAIIVTSFYFFPFNLAFLPVANTKLIMAIISIPLLLSDIASKHKGNIKTDLLILCLFAFGVSLTSFAAVVYNNTNDYCYVTYIISMLVWLGGAYTLVRLLKLIHGYISVELLFNYLFIVCVFQCLLAIAISHSPIIDRFASYIYSDYKSLKDFADGRLYGIGCAFDVAGMRMSTIEIIFGCLLYKLTDKYRDRSWIIGLYIMGFAIIAVIGNMIARSTLIGLLIAFFIILYSLVLRKMRIDTTSSLAIKWFLGISVLAVAGCILMYNVDQQFKADLRFGFEGFFSLAETGKWNVRSNDVLLSMYRFPESVKTWIIGDGYIVGTTTDPYYTGIDYKGYYMGTDVGYLRFIYYSGLIGLGAFVLFMFKVAQVCKKWLPANKAIFSALLLLQLIVWFKVASDIFSVFALFLVVSWLQDETKEPAVDSNQIYERNTLQEDHLA